MPTPEIRPMTAADVDEAAEMILRHDWGVRREWLQFASTQAACAPFVALADGEVVGTGVGTANGPVGWIGTIFVHPGWRGRGLGRGLTQATIDALEGAGCETLVLVATKEGRPVYERMGFELQARYRILEAPGVEAETGDAAVGSPSTRVVRGFEPSDLPAMLRLDRVATGEDRAHALRRLADGTSARVLVSAGELRGFVVRAPWGGGATVAATVDDAMAVIEARRRAAGAAGRVRVGVLDANEAGLEALAAAGFHHEWSAPRLVRGATMTWRPELIWGQFNHAVG
jgi:predicted N-acetyltransferase YhbS